MDTPSIDPRFSQNPAPKSWHALVGAARREAPPAEVDVRFLVRAALEKAPREALAGRPSGVLEEIAALGQSWAVRLALAACAVVAAVALWDGLDAATGLNLALDLQSLFF